MIEELKAKTETLSHNISEYIDTYYKLTMVKVTQKATNVTSAVMAGLTTLFLSIITLFFLGMGLSWWLGDLLNSQAAGFFIVGGIFILMMVLLIVLRKKIVFPFLKKAILKRLYE
ncbi:MAG TPA: phage holin family protein [Chitinophagaceae bacterium]|jgi:hypothetical protein|nr:phage holin family protein [Chitinophagaceae bacterium]